VTVAWAEVLETCRKVDLALTYGFDVREFLLDRRRALAEWAPCTLNASGREVTPHASPGQSARRFSPPGAHPERQASQTATVFNFRETVERAIIAA
jgi:hypothetical protein